MLEIHKITLPGLVQLFNLLHLILRFVLRPRLLLLAPLQLLVLYVFLPLLYFVYEDYCVVLEDAVEVGVDPARVVVYSTDPLIVQLDYVLVLLLPTSGFSLQRYYPVPLVAIQQEEHQLIDLDQALCYKPLLYFRDPQL